MKLNQIVSYAVIGAGLAVLSGCDEKNQPAERTEPIPYVVTQPFNERHTSAQSGIGVALGDVNGDGNNDLIIASPSSVRVFINNHGVFEEKTE